MDSPRCDRCLYVVAHCLCPAIAAVGPLTTRTRVIILRHYSERTRSSNSGRLAHQALAGSELYDVGGPERDFVPPTVGDGAYLVFPGGAPQTEAPSPPPRTLIFLDATWQQARRMRTRLGFLRGVPTLALAPIPAADRFRAAPAAGLVSTIEAIATALRLVEGEPVPTALEGLFATAVEHANRLGRRSVPPRG